LSFKPRSGSDATIFCRWRLFKISLTRTDSRQSILITPCSIPWLTSRGSRLPGDTPRCALKRFVTILGNDGILYCNILIPYLCMYRYKVDQISNEYIPVPLPDCNSSQTHLYFQAELRRSKTPSRLRLLGFWKPPHLPLDAVRSGFPQSEQCRNILLCSKSWWWYNVPSQHCSKVGTLCRFIFRKSNRQFRMWSASLLDKPRLTWIGLSNFNVSICISLYPMVLHLVGL
jgi:hypothetical protein